VPDHIVPARAVENQVFVAYCNHAGVENGMRFLGGSLLADIDGKAIAAAGAGDALIIGEISQARRLAAAKCFPYMTDRRPELYAQLTSNFDGQC
jgi:predicted amidohydrolase